jgi:molecular chaperone DnaK (HSP70)
MEEELIREEGHLIPPADVPEMEMAAGSKPIPPKVRAMEEDIFEDEIEGAELTSSGSPEDEQGKALQSSIGLGLPSDRYRVVLPKGSFPPLSGRQQFIARLRDKDRVSFRVFMGDEELASQNEFLAELGMVGVALNNDDKAFLELHFTLNLDKILTVRLLDKFGEKEALLIMDMARKPKVTIAQDKLAELIDKLDTLERRISEIGDRVKPKG